MLVEFFLQIPVAPIEACPGVAPISTSPGGLPSGDVVGSRDPPRPVELIRRRTGRDVAPRAVGRGLEAHGVSSRSDLNSEESMGLGNQSA